MAGICGWIGGNIGNAEGDKIINSMTSVLGESAGRVTSIGIGALGVQGSQNMTSLFSDSEICVACAGMIYAKSERLQEQIIEQGAAAAIANGYLRHGMNILQEIHGQFSLAIVDPAERSVILGIDRIGIYPLYYTQAGDSIIFGSRADCVAAHPLSSNVIDSQAIYDYLYFHMIPSPRAIYGEQEKLLPAQYVRFSQDKTEKGFYWHIPYEDHNSTSLEDLKSEFHSLLDTAVKRGISNGNTGSFLSGGTDSSTMAGKLTQLGGKPADTYSIGFDAPGYDEMEYARIAVKHFGTKPHEYYVTPDDVVQAIPEIAQYYDEPFGNASAIPTYYCAKMAVNDGISTMIAGDGGDEIFAGNTRYATQEIFNLYSYIPGFLRAIAEPIALRFPGGQHIPPLRKLQSYIRQARLPMPDRMETYNFLHRTPSDEIFSRDFLNLVDIDDPLKNLREVYSRTHSDSMLHHMLHLDMKITIADNDLRKVGRMCELAGIDVRYPLLDEDLVEFSAKIPPALKLKGKHLRYFFKDALQDFLPAEILTKSKHGFGLPFGLWMTTYKPLKELAYDSLLSFRKRGYLKGSYLDWLLKMHGTEHASYYGVMIWVLMMLEQWLEKKNI